MQRDRGSVRGVAILGATGSIGRQTLEVVAAHPDRLRVVALAAASRAEEVVAVALRFGAEAVALADPAAAQRAGAVLKAGGGRVPAGGGGLSGDVNLPPDRVNGDGAEGGLAAGQLARGGAGAAAERDGRGPALLSGPEGVCEVAAWPSADIVVAGIAGLAGLLPTLRAAASGKRVALANKEALVVAGPLVQAAAARSGAEVVPVDSEHSAIWQALRGHDRDEVRRLVLTASGGPFRGMDRDAMAQASPREALRHPRWRMGPRITVDSATLMNKGFEVIEAHRLFDLPPDPSRIAVVVHPESVVHSLVEFVDGTLLGQLGQPDMRLPIQYALSYPERWSAEGLRDADGRAPEGLDLARLQRLTFEEPDREAFPCLDLAYAAAAAGGTAPAVLNAADEVAVARFLDGGIRFGDVARLIAAVLDQHTVVARPGLDDLLAADAWARRRAAEWAPVAVGGR